MCWIASQLKKMIRLKYLIPETPYTFFSTFSWYFSVTYTERSITCVLRYYQQQLFLVLLEGYGDVILLLCLFLGL